MCHVLLIVDQLVLWPQTLSGGGLHGGPAFGVAPIIQAEVDARVGAAVDDFSDYNAIPMQQDAYKRSCAAGVSLTLTRPD